MEVHRKEEVNERVGNSFDSDEALRIVE